MAAVHLEHTLWAQKEEEEPFTDETQTALFKVTARTAL